MGQGWKNGTELEKMGQLFCREIPLEKMRQVFFHYFFPNKLVDQIRQRKILTGQAAIRIISARRGRKLCHIMWWQFSYTKPEVLSVSLSLSYNVYPE